MKIRLLWIFALLFLPSCFEFHGVTSFGYKEEEIITKENNVRETVLVTIDSGAGSIDITSSDKPKITIDAIKRGETKADLANVEADIKVSEGSVKIRTNYKKRNVNAVIDYEITVPLQATLKHIATGSGSIIIDGVKGDTKVRSGSGSIDITGAIGAIEAETGSGSITIETIQGADDTIKATTGSGDVEIINAKGTVDAESGSGTITIVCDQGSTGDIKAQTGSGRIEVAESCSTVNASTGSGTIIIKQKHLPDVARIDASTSSGKIELYLPPEVNADLEVFAPRGRFTSAFSISRKEENDRVGTIGKGGPQISLRSANGNIKISKI